MAISKLNLTRDQLASFLKDHEQIRQFERLFATVDAIAPDFVNEVSIAAGTAQATANDALALIESLENSLTADGAVIDAKTTLALQELQVLKSELQLKALEPAEQYNNAIITDHLTINENGRGESAVGRMVWDDGNGTVSLGLKGGNVDCKIGEQEYARVYNDTALAMTKGQVVYISGAQGNRVAVKLAKADTDANSAHTIGFVAETIAAGNEGWVQISGPIYKLNTLGTTAGDIVYLSPTTFGAWTTTKPVAPDHLVVVGFVERVHASVGSIFIKVDNGYELDELHNVKITSVSNGQLIAYDSLGPFWKNVSPSSITAGSVANAVTFNSSGLGDASGTTFNGSAARTVSYNTIGAQPSGTYVTSVSGIAPVTSSGGTTPAISMAAATGSANGYLTSTDWTTFNGKQAALISGTNIKTVNGASLLGAGDLGIIGPTYGGTGVNNGTRTLTVNSNSGTLAFTNAATTLTVANTGSISGTNTGDQTITLTGDVTGSGTGSFATTIAAASTGTGNLVRATSPTITTPTISTSATVPILIGGTAVSSTLSLRPTSGAGGAFADIVFQVGNNGATEAARIKGSGNVGIGTSSPSATLEVANQNIDFNAVFTKSGITSASIILRTSNGTLASPTQTVIGDPIGSYCFGGYNGLTFTAARANIVGYAAETFTSSANGTDLAFITTNLGTLVSTEKMRLTGDGRLDVFGAIRSESTNYPNFLFNSSNRICYGETFPPPNDVNNSIVSYGSGSPSMGMALSVGKTGVHTSFFGDTGSAFILGTEGSADIVFSNNLSYFAADVINSGVERMRISGAGNVGINTSSPGYLLDVNGTANATLLRSNGVQFPATQVPSADANTLDDYEEGTFTPTIVGVTTAGVGTYTIQTGQYTKVGRAVHFTLYMNWTAHTGTGTMRVAGLPFNSSGVANSFASVAIGFWNNIAITAAATPMAHVLLGAAQIILYQMPSGGGAMALVNMDVSGSIMLSGTYFTG